MKIFRQNKVFLVLCLIIWVFLLPACQPGTPSPQPTEGKTTIPETQAPTSTPEPTIETPEEETATAPVETEVTDVPSLPPGPVSLTIDASDGTQLDGRFYPASGPDAPLLVLFHWAPGDQSEWEAIAPWLQNRGNQPDLPENRPPWLIADWFPEMPIEASFNVLTFTFRGCEGGCQAFDREGWLLDVQAVMDYLQTLEDVDLSHVGTIGASIGADGAAFGCQYYNEQYGGCQGALSLSPGGYLTIPYPEVVQNLGSADPPRPAWCLFSTGDSESAGACETATGDHYRAVAYPGSAHGMAMVVPEQDPNPLSLMLDFLVQTGLCPECP